jgi:hypothetical protein
VSPPITWGRKFSGSVRKSIGEFRSFRRAQQSRCLPPRHLRKETDRVSETLCSFMFFKNTGRWISKKKDTNPEYEFQLLQITVNHSVPISSKTYELPHITNTVKRLFLLLSDWMRFAVRNKYFSPDGTIESKQSVNTQPSCRHYFLHKTYKSLSNHGL